MSINENIYVISAHGKIIGQKPIYLRNGVSIVTYCKVGGTCYAKCEDQKALCDSEGLLVKLPHSGDFQRRAWTETAPNILFTALSSTQRGVKSGLVHCATNEVIYNIDTQGPITLKTILAQVPLDSEVHLFTCLSSDHQIRTLFRSAKSPNKKKNKVTKKKRRKRRRSKRKKK